MYILIFYFDNYIYMRNEVEPRDLEFGLKYDL